MTFAAGDKPTARQIEDLRGLTAYKVGDTSIVASTTLTNDPELFVSVAALTTYAVDAFFIVNASVAGKLLLAATGPVGATFAHWLLGAASTASTSTGVVDHFAFTTFGSWARGGTAAEEGLIMTGTLTTSGAAGTFRIQWAQNAASGTTTMKTGSRITLRKIS